MHISVYAFAIESLTYALIMTGSYWNNFSRKIAFMNCFTIQQGS